MFNLTETPSHKSLSLQKKDMSTFTIDIHPTSNDSIKKFETNQFLTNHDSFEFNNIDDAKPSPMAQQLFHLPFVKTVYIAQNFIAIQKYDIVEWSDVEDAVKEQLLDYLNSGQKAIVDATPQKKSVPVTVYAESTPNPAVLKFVTNKKLVVQTEEFKSIDDATHAPLAQALFHFPFVKEIFMDENYVSIQKYDMASWEDITTELRDFISNHIKDGKAIVTKHKDVIKTTAKGDTNSTAKISTEGLDDISKAIVEILDEYIKPAVASDGGNIAFDSYDAETKSVKVILQGACSGCPSSTMTLKNGIETMLRDMLDGKVQHVEAING